MCWTFLDEQLIARLINSSGVRQDASNRLMKLVKQLPGTVLEHSLRVSRDCKKLAESECLRFSKDETECLQVSGFLHDVGKYFIHDAILQKPAELTPEEYRKVQKHTDIGHRVLMNMGVHENICLTILSHHENFDGSGYPHGLVGEEIPCTSRILHIVDVYDALTNHRPYRSAYNAVDAIDMMIKQTRKFDPHYFELFLNS